MKRRLRILLAVAVVVPVILLSGCLFNIFQTAQMVRSGDMSILIGSGLMDISGGVGDPAWSLTPQARMEFGLSDSINLGLHTGVLIPLSSGSPGWMGLAGDLKFLLVNDPKSISLAAGFGGGNGIHFLGWGAFGEVYLDLNVFPLFFAYQPTIPLEADTFTVWHDVAIGLALPLSKSARILIQVDTRNLSLFSYGIGFEISF
jgi:hypothetical protein